MKKEMMSWEQLGEILIVLFRALISRTGKRDLVSRSAAQRIIGMAKGNPEVLVEEFMKFLKDGGRTAISGLRLETVPFDPGTFLGGNYSVWCGPADGNGLEGEEARDLRASKMKDIDWGKVLFSSPHRKEESAVPGEERLVRCQETGDILLEGNAFVSLWRDYLEKGENSVLEKLRKEGGIQHIAFLGLIIRDGASYYPKPRRRFLCLHTRGHDNFEWVFACNPLGAHYSPGSLVASIVN